MESFFHLTTWRTWYVCQISLIPDYPSVYLRCYLISFPPSPLPHSFAPFLGWRPNYELLSTYAVWQAIFRRGRGRCVGGATLLGESSDDGNSVDVRQSVPFSSLVSSFFFVHSPLFASFGVFVDLLFPSLKSALFQYLSLNPWPYYN